MGKSLECVVPGQRNPEVQGRCRNAGGTLPKKDTGAGVHEALLHFVDGALIWRGAL